MTKAVCRLGDYSTGHEDYPPRPNIEASTTVFVNGLGVHCVGDAWATHCDESCHGGVLQTGSSTVFVNGKAVGRIDDPISCGDYVRDGSPNVFVN